MLYSIGDTRVLGGHHGRERAAADGTRFEVTKLPFQIRHEPSAILALEGPQVIHSPLEFPTVLDQ
jgi:hypothetical protein